MVLVDRLSGSGSGICSGSISMSSRGAFLGDVGRILWGSIWGGVGVGSWVGKCTKVVCFGGDVGRNS